MTSPLRKKHRTTRRNIPRTNRFQVSGVRCQDSASAIYNPQSAIRNPKSVFCLSVVVVVVLVLGAATSSASELQWQRGQTPKSKSAAQGSSRFQRHRDSGVRPAAYEDEGVVGPRLTSGDEGRATFRSIVVNQGEESNAVRSAQRQGAGESAPPTGAQPTTPGAGESLEEKIGIPFGDLPQQQTPIETPDLETPQLPGEDADRLQLDNNLRQPGERAPQTFQPLPPPERGATDSSAEQEMTSDVTATTPEPGTNRESCEQSWANLKAKTIGTVDLSIAVTGTEGDDFPYECQIQDGGLSVGRCWPQITYLWKASALCHKPLYFEDEQLERYGHSWPPCIQPLCSSAHFFCTLPVLPYCMGVEPPMECIYALGHYRPGNCAPYMFDPVPLSCRGALFQAGAVVGTAAVLP